jgi:hypothetical protein
MSKITLLQIKTIEYTDVNHLKLLISKHKEQLGKCIMRLDSPGTIAIIQAISYNLIHLTRDLERMGGISADFHFSAGEKKH